jgi:hypothetical protein
MGNQLSTQVEAIFSNDNVSALSNLLSSRTVTSVDAPIDEVENTLLHLAVQHGKSRKKERINAFFSWRLTKSEKRFFFFFFFFFFQRGNWLRNVANRKWRVKQRRKQTGMHTIAFRRVCWTRSIGRIAFATRC